MKTLTTLIIVLCMASFAAAGLQDGLVAYWTFDEGTGTIAYDSAGNYDGTVQGAMWTTGKIGGALQFDGLNDYVAPPTNNPIWLPQNDFTLSAWVYFDKDPSSKHDFVLGLQFGYATTHSFCTGYAVFRNCNDGMGRFQFATQNSDYNLNSDVMAKNTWYHITAVRQGMKQEIYLDGQLNAFQTCSGDPIKFDGTGSDGSVNIGRYKDINPGGAYYLDGLIDDVRIYNRALTAQEIWQLYTIPEPATFFLLGLGGATLYRRRRIIQH